MRVLVVIDSLAPGGAERSLVASAPGLRDLGIEVEVVTLFDRPGLQEELRANGGRLIASLDESSRLRAMRALRRVLDAHRPDIVHTTLFEADVIGRIASALERRPVVSSLVNTAYRPDGSRRDDVRRTRLVAARGLDVATARLVRRFHAVSEVVAMESSRRLLVPLSRVDVVWRGRDLHTIGTLSDARRIDARAALGLARDAKVAVMLSRHERDKGIDIAISAVERVRVGHPELVLVVAGRTGRETAALERRIAAGDLLDAVRLLGPRSDAMEVLAAADLLVAPSRREGLPGTVLEAMGLGIPIVASDLPSIREAVPDEHHALLVPPEDVDALARGIERVFAEPASTADRVRHSRDRFLERFTIERAVDGMARFYERALTTPRRRP